MSTPSRVLVFIGSTIASFATQDLKSKYSQGEAKPPASSAYRRRFPTGRSLS